MSYTLITIIITICAVSDDANNKEIHKVKHGKSYKVDKICTGKTFSDTGTRFLDECISGCTKEAGCQRGKH